MKYAKFLGLLAVAVAAVMAFAGTASATQLTCKNAAGTGLEVCTPTIHAVSEGTTTLHNTTLGIDIKCEESTVQGTVASHGTTVTAKGAISTLTFNKCGEDNVTVLKSGELEVHTEYTTETNGEKKQKTEATGSGTLTSSGAEITIATRLGISCTYTTSGTDLGTITGSIKTGSTATLDIESATISRTGDSGLCGSSGTWTGSYKVDTVAVGGTDRQDYLDID